MKCVVKNCQNEQRNKNSKKTFFLFPRDATLCKKWLKFCQNKGEFNPKTWRICVDHFKDEDIYGNGMYNMGYATKRTLKTGAVPCLYKEKCVQNSERDERAVRRKNKEIVASLLTVAEHVEKPIESTFLENIEFDTVWFPSQDNDVEDISCFENVVPEASPDQEDKIQMLEKEIKKLKEENDKLKDDFWRSKDKLEYEISGLQKKMCKAESHYADKKIQKAGKKSSGIMKHPIGKPF